MSTTKKYDFPVVKYRDGTPATFFRSKIVYAEQHEKVVKENSALREALDEAMKVYLSEPDGSADHTEIAHDMYAVLERAHRAALGKEERT